MQEINLKQNKIYKDFVESNKLKLYYFSVDQNMSVMQFVKQNVDIEKVEQNLRNDFDLSTIDYNISSTDNSYLIKIIF